MEFRQMGLSVASNRLSVMVQTDLAKTSEDISATYERLSSGLRINSASDDPAGLALAATLRNQTQLATVAIRNANDGLSLAALADSALNEISNMLSRMSELATQSANGIYSTAQRSAMSSEFVALGSEIERIASSTTYNDIKLLSDSSNITLQVGFDSRSTSQISITGVLATLASLGLANSGSSTLSFSIISTTSTNSQLAATNAMSAIQTALDSVTSRRGTVGAAESRLNSAINYLTVARENLAAAESRIRDADVAEEVAKLVRLQVLEKAETALLAQANQSPALVLELLR